jgi:predicted membrane-bound mannosyltransferase
VWSIVGHWSYTGNPATSDRDAVRFLVGDTDDRDQLVADEEIAWALTDQTAVRAAAAVVCETIAARFAREADTTINTPNGLAQTQAYSQRSRAYRTMASDLRAQLASGATADDVLPYCGGISSSTKETYVEDSDRVPPSFWRHQHDNPTVEGDAEDLTEVTT